MVDSSAIVDLQICKNLEGEGGYLDRRELHNGFDSNAITPGTEFMRRVAERLRIFICTQLLTQPAWQHLQVRLLPLNAHHPGVKGSASCLKSNVSSAAMRRKHSQPSMSRSQK